MSQSRNDTHQKIRVDETQRVKFKYVHHKINIENGEIKRKFDVRKERKHWESDDRGGKRKRKREKMVIKEEKKS